MVNIPVGASRCGFFVGIDPPQRAARVGQVLVVIGELGFDHIALHPQHHEAGAAIHQVVHCLQHLRGLARLTSVQIVDEHHQGARDTFSCRFSWVKTA